MPSVSSPRTLIHFVDDKGLGKSPEPFSFLEESPMDHRLSIILATERVNRIIASYALFSVDPDILWKMEQAAESLLIKIRKAKEEANAD